MNQEKFPIHYSVKEGIGIPIYLVHTIPIDSTYLRTSLDNFLMNNPVIFLDLPNHGQSDDVYKPKDMNFKNLAKGIDDLRKHLNHEKIIIFGHGLGGLITLTYVSLYPKTLAAVVVFATASSSKYREKLAWNIRSKYSPVIKDLLDNYYESAEEKALAVKFAQSYAMYFKEPNYEISKQLIEDSSRVVYNVYTLLQHDMVKYNVREKIRKYTGPMLILTAQFDVWPKKITEMIQNDIPHADLHNFQGDYGHFIMLENPNEFWGYIQDWVSQKVN
jgi:proline iminopeptidase